MAAFADALLKVSASPLDATVHIDEVAQSHPEVDAATVAVLRDTLLYRITPASVDDHAGAVLSPLDGSVWPVALRDAPPDVRSLWSALAVEVSHSAMKARCWDIVFTLKLSQGREAAEKAVRAYGEAPTTRLAPDSVAEHLVRGWTLARQVGLVALEGEITASMRRLVEDALDRQADPHAVTVMLAALTAPPRRSRTPAPPVANVAELLDRAVTTYPEIHIIDDLVTLVRKHASNDPGRVNHASRHLINTMMAEAQRHHEPMVTRTMLADAAAQAKRFGLADLERAAITSLQAAPAPTWQTTRHEVPIPDGYHDQYLPGFAQAQDWRQALFIWLRTSCPSGRLETNQVTAQQVEESSVFRRLATTVVFRDDGLPARTLDPGSASSRELSRIETLSMGAHGLVLGRALHQIRVRFGIPDRADVEEFLASSGAPMLVSTLAEAFELFWIGRYRASAHLAVPLVEAAVRALLLEFNEPIYRAQAGDTPGQFAGLGALLDSLISIDFDPDWERFLRTLLLGEGANIRNLTAHGFLHDIDPVNAALVLRAAAVVVMLTSDGAVREDDAAVRASTPRGVPAPRRWPQRVSAALWAAWMELKR
ncbi:DUF7380 domain-containing protein [Actinokineospora globicatena]|uniref:DUF7380 domain-containing protein n=1 Tax=Actinokineospora globicatena TaxID=103729 RepID=UPI0020A3368C|nr:hypothetical protein [Actinokineospora globicatena]